MNKKTYLSIVFTILFLTLCFGLRGASNEYLATDGKKETVEKLADLEEYDVVFQKIDQPDSATAPWVTLYNCSGWKNTEPGDFTKIQIELENKSIVEFTNRDAWVRIKDRVKVPVNSLKIKKAEHFISLDMGLGQHILILLGYGYASNPGLLTIIHVGQNTAKLIFNKEINLLEITETDFGYQLTGKFGISVNYSKPCEILIKEHQLLFRYPQVDAPDCADVVLKDCNGVDYMFQELTGSKALHQKTANQIMNLLYTSDHWGEMPISDIQEAVNSGMIIIAGTSNEKGPGHVVGLNTGEQVFSNKWRANVPVAMDSGEDKLWTRKSINYSWKPESKSDIKFYYYRGPMYK